jgi:hypothetical protein
MPDPVAADIVGVKAQLVLYLSVIGLLIGVASAASTTPTASTDKQSPAAGVNHATTSVGDSSELPRVATAQRFADSVVAPSDKPKKSRKNGPTLP